MVLDDCSNYWQLLGRWRKIAFDVGATDELNSLGRIGMMHNFVMRTKRRTVEKFAKKESKPPTQASALVMDRFQRMIEQELRLIDLPAEKETD